LKLKALAPSYPETEMYIQLSGKASDRVEILMSNAPGGLGGTISLAGRPLDSALVILSKKQALETPVASSLTDSAGKYTLSGFQVGSYVLTVEAPVGSGESVTRRTIEVAIADANARQDVDIPLPSPVGGRVTVGGKTPPVKDGAGLVLLFIPKGGGGEGRTITIKPDGTYASELEPGTYSVGLEDRPGHDVEVPTGGNMNLDLAF